MHHLGVDSYHWHQGGLTKTNWFQMAQNEYVGKFGSLVNMWF
jgi:hypothetical protein